MTTRRTTGRAPGTRRHRIPNRGLAACLAAAGLLLTACSSAASSSSASGSAAASPAITVMTIGPVNTALTPYPQIPEAAKLYAEYANARGGIAGHPLTVLTCDDQGVPDQAMACAREAVSDHVVAVVGSFSINQDLIIPILQSAGIAYFGTCCAFSTQDLTSPVSFPIGSQTMIDVGIGAAAGSACSRIGFVNIAGAPYQAFFDKIEHTALTPSGKPVTAEADMPITASDVAPYIAKVVSGTDCIMSDLPQANWQLMVPAIAQAGGHQRLIGMQGNLDVTSCAGQDATCKSAIVVGLFPDLSSAPFADFRQAIATYHAPSKYDYDSLAGLGTWAAYTAFADIVSGMKGSITAVSFLAAASHADDVTTGGETPALNFTKFWDVAGQGRFFNRSVVFEEYQNGTLKPIDDNRFFDMTPAYFGRAVPGLAIPAE
jgi:ABC-type branched-subunit amino acid transport system substrate-binding protein